MQSIKEGAPNQSAVLFGTLCGCPGRPFLVLGEMFSLLQCVSIRAKAVPGRRSLLGMWKLSGHEVGCSVFIYIVLLISSASLGHRPLEKGCVSRCCFHSFVFWAVLASLSVGES